MEEPIYMEYLKEDTLLGKEEPQPKKIQSFAMIPYHSLKDGNIEGVMGCKALIDNVCRKIPYKDPSPEYT